MTDFGLSKETINDIVTIVKNNLGNTKNAKLYIFGSRATKNFRKYSDIDLLLAADEYDTEKLSSISDEFSDSDIPFCIDFVLGRDLYEAYSENINKEKKLLKVF